jgi:hypothetical protein
MKIFSITIIPILAFSGVLFALFPYGDAIQKFFIIIFSIILHYRFFISKQSLRLVWLFLLYLFFSIGVMLLYSSPFLTIILTMQPFALGLLIYLWVSNISLGANHYKTLKRLVYAIIIVQFIFALVKLNIHGLDEGFLIGTMSHQAGQLAFFIPAIAIPILFFLMNKRNGLMIFLLILAMFAFSIINEKRAGVYLLPLITLFSYIYILNKKFNINSIVSIVIVSIVVLSFIAVGLSQIPALNVEETIGGSISLPHMYNYAITYLTMDYGGPLQGSYEQSAINTDIQVGRITLLIFIIDSILSADLPTMLFGLGPGSITPSAWLNESNDVIYDMLGTRGAISGLGLSLVETGLVGAFILSSFFIYSFRKIRKMHKTLQSSIAKKWIRVLIVIFLIFCFDFFFYSTVLFRTMPMPLLFWGALGSIFIVKRLDLKLLNMEKYKTNPQGQC